jgi:hypothetical protein
VPRPPGHALGRFLGAWPVLIRHWFIQNAPIARLLQVGGHTQNQPKRIVVETAANLIVAAFGQRLVLVICATRLQLRGGEIQDALTGQRRNHVDKAQQVLIGVTEAHAAPDARFKIGG